MQRRLLELECMHEKSPLKNIKFGVIYFQLLNKSYIKVLAI